MDFYDANLQPFTLQSNTYITNSFTNISENAVFLHFRKWRIAVFISQIVINFVTT